MIEQKKAQAQIVTIILIILLVLAAIVIVWQVIQGTVETGADQITEQSRCIGVNLDVTLVSATVFNVKRAAQGETFTAADVAVLVDGVRLATDTGYALSASTLEGPLGTGTITFDVAPTSEVEVALVGDGVTCPSTGKLEI